MAQLENRREFLRLAASAAGGLAALDVLPRSIRRALAIPAATITGTIRDVKHVVILMQENRSFDHYFGTLRGVRGFGDRHPVPLPGGRTVWQQSDGRRELAPFHFDTRTTSAAKTPGTPHSFSDAQAAWNQGKLDEWPRFKTALSMGHYRRSDLPFQFALAESFTICDAYHCSVTSGTDPNRIVFWSGSSFDPERRRRGENCTAAHSEPNNLRCWIKGALPKPGYTYAGSAFAWPTIPDVLEAAGIDWRIYQDPNDNWTGAMHGCLAFASFRGAEEGSPLWRKGMSLWTLEQLAADVKADRLPAVSWVLPPARWSEHPASSPAQGAEFTARVLDALTGNPKVWGSTVFFVTFDENDGFFDHVPPPAPPSYDADGTPCGKSTLDLAGMYFSDPERKCLHPDDRTSGTLRPWGLGPRVPMYVVSPWSKGGWVDSQVFDHTSVGRFLEQRFGVEIPAISPWHRAVCGDLTSAFDFAAPRDPRVPALPEVRSSVVLRDAAKRPKPAPPAQAEPLFQERGVRPSRALPYELDVAATDHPTQPRVALRFRNGGAVGAVFHVYDRLRLDCIPRRYTVEAGKELDDEWSLTNDGAYDLWVYGPNGFVREFVGRRSADEAATPAIELRREPGRPVLELVARNPGRAAANLIVRANAYRDDGPWRLRIEPGEPAPTLRWSLAGSGNWYDFSVATEDGTAFVRRFAGRLETGAHGTSDPALAR